MNLTQQDGYEEEEEEEETEFGPEKEELEMLL